MKVSRDHTLYYHPYNHLSPQKMVAFTIRLCYSYMRCGVWRSLVARTAGGREVAGSNPVAPIINKECENWTTYQISHSFCFL